MSISPGKSVVSELFVNISAAWLMLIMVEPGEIERLFYKLIFAIVFLGFALRLRKGEVLYGHY